MKASFYLFVLALSCVVTSVVGQDRSTFAALTLKHPPHLLTNFEACVAMGSLNKVRIVMKAAFAAFNAS